MNLRQSIAEKDARRAHARADTIRMAKEGLEALTPDAATALICDYIAAAPLGKVQIKKLARAANDRQWASI